MHTVGVKDVRPDVVGIMRLDTCAVELRRLIAQDVARQEHAGPALPPMQPVPISRFLMYSRSRMEKYFRHRARRVGSLPSRQRSIFSLRSFPSASVGSCPSETESNMLSQQSRRSPVWVKRSKTA